MSRLTHHDGFHFFDICFHVDGTELLSISFLTTNIVPYLIRTIPNVPEFLPSRYSSVFDN